MRELTLTLLLLGVVIVVAVRLIDLRTKLLVVEKDVPGLGGVLEVAVRSVSRDLEGAFRGGVPAFRGRSPGRGQHGRGGRHLLPRRREERSPFERAPTSSAFAG